MPETRSRSADIRTATELSHRPEPRYRLAPHLGPQLARYLTHYYDAYHLEPDKAAEIEPVISEHLARHDYVSGQYQSRHFVYATQNAKDMFKGARLGDTNCVDGRLPRRMNGHVIPRWTIAGGRLTTHDVDGQQYIAAGKLVVPIINAARSGDDLLEVHGGHYSAVGPYELACAAIKNYIVDTLGGNPHDYDLQRLNVKLMQEQAQAVTRLFNAARLETGNKKLQPLARAAITSMLCTDDASITFMGNDEERPLNTGDVTLGLLQRGMEEAIMKEFPHHTFGLMRQSFTRVDSVVPFEWINMQLSQFLLDYKPFTREINAYIGSSGLNALTEHQKQAFMYYCARNVAILYQTGLVAEREQPNHPFLQHAEEYAGISQSGLHVGLGDPGRQVLKANPANVNVAIEQMNTQLAVLSAYNPRKPHIFYVTTAVPVSETRAEIDDAKAQNYNLMYSLVQHPDFERRIAAGELVMVPVLMNEERRNIIRIPNHFM